MGSAIAGLESAAIAAARLRSAIRPVSSSTVAGLGQTEGFIRRLPTQRIGSLVSNPRLNTTRCRVPASLRPLPQLRCSIPSARPSPFAPALPFHTSTSLRRTILDAAVSDPAVLPRLPFRFETGEALYAKRPPRPFPPPFMSPPSGSFSDPLTTHHHGRGTDRRATFVNGQLIQGVTNGDDALFASEYFVCVNDGVGAWSSRPRGHAG